MPLRQITAAEFEQEVLRQPGPVVVDFSASWCPPCRALLPVLERYAEEQGGAATVLKLDVDADEEVAERYQVRTIPTLIAFRNGDEVRRAVNPRTRAELDQLLES